MLLPAQREKCEQPKRALESLPLCQVLFSKSLDYLIFGKRFRCCTRYSRLRRLVITIIIIRAILISCSLIQIDVAFFELAIRNARGFHRVEKSWTHSNWQEELANNKNGEVTQAPVIHFINEDSILIKTAKHEQRHIWDNHVNGATNEQLLINSMW